MDRATKREFNRRSKEMIRKHASISVQETWQNDGSVIRKVTVDESNPQDGELLIKMLSLSPAETEEMMDQAQGVEQAPPSPEAEDMAAEPVVEGEQAPATQVDDQGSIRDRVQTGKKKVTSDADRDWMILARGMFVAGASKEEVEAELKKHYVAGDQLGQVMASAMNLVNVDFVMKKKSDDFGKVGTRCDNCGTTGYATEENMACPAHCGGIMRKAGLKKKASKYESIVFMQGEEADEPLKILEEQGEEAALEFLKQWDYGEGGETYNENPAGDDDDEYRSGNYIMSYNTRIGTIGLCQVLADNDPLYQNAMKKKADENSYVPPFQVGDQVIFRIDKMNGRWTGYQADWADAGTIGIVTEAPEFGKSGDLGHNMRIDIDGQSVQCDSSWLKKLAMKKKALNSADVIGYAYNGDAYCSRDCVYKANPSADEEQINPIFGDEAESFAGYPCGSCGGVIVEGDAVTAMEKKIALMKTASPVAEYVSENMVEFEKESPERMRTDLVQKGFSKETWTISCPSFLGRRR